jgi:hypothetical protein
MYVDVATKTISIDVDAYERLRAARLRPDESFSRVIKRAQWTESPSTGATLLRALEAAPVPGQRVLKRLEKAQESDAPPESAWND